MRPVFCILGKSASGKTTICQELEKRYGYRLLRSYITRPRRGDDDNDHTFITPEEAAAVPAEDMIAFTDQIDEYVRFATVGQLAESDLYIIDPAGLDYLYDCQHPTLKNIRIVTIYIGSVFCQSYDKALKRGDDMTAWMDRYERECKMFSEYDKEFDYIVDNSFDLGDAIKEMRDIIEYEKKEHINKERV